MRPCPSCSQPLAANARACPACGHRPHTLLARLFLWLVVIPTAAALFVVWLRP